MKQLRRLGVVLAIVAAAPLVLAPAAEAKVLPYDLTVEGSVHRPGQRVLVVMEIHPQNVLPVWFDFEVRWVKVRKNQLVANAAKRRGNKIVMMQVGPKEYHGVFTPQKAGLHVVSGRTAVGATDDAGYPRPIPVRVVR